MKAKTLICMALLAVSLTGCGTTATQKRMEGFDLSWHGFAAVEAVPESGVLDHTISLDGWTVRIIGHEGLFTHPKYRDTAQRVAGCVLYPEYRRIEILGKLAMCSDGRKRVVVSWAVLGHELAHILNLVDPHIADPDRYGEWGF